MNQKVQITRTGDPLEIMVHLFNSAESIKQRIKFELSAELVLRLCALHTAEATFFPKHNQTFNHIGVMFDCGKSWVEFKTNDFQSFYLVEAEVEKFKYLPPTSADVIYHIV